MLAAYSMYNTEVGYCQGMSQVAAILLMYMNEEVGFVVKFDIDLIFSAKSLRVVLFSETLQKFPNGLSEYQ